MCVNDDITMEKIRKGKKCVCRLHNKMNCITKKVPIELCGKNEKKV